MRSNPGKCLFDSESFTRDWNLCVTRQSEAGKFPSTTGIYLKARTQLLAYYGERRKYMNRVDTMAHYHTANNELAAGLRSAASAGISALIRPAALPAHSVGSVIPLPSAVPAPQQHSRPAVDAADEPERKGQRAE